MQLSEHIRDGYNVTHRLLYVIPFEGKGAGNPIPNDSVDRDDDPDALFVGLFFGCLIFGGIHLAAWTFHFPTRVELILWRVASIWCTAVALVTLIILKIAEKVVEFLNDIDDTDEMDSWMFSILQIFLALYVICRLILLVEIFRTLFFLPPDAFVATSASNIPHVA